MLFTPMNIIIIITSITKTSQEHDIYSVSDQVSFLPTLIRT